MSNTSEGAMNETEIRRTQEEILVKAQKYKEEDFLPWRMFTLAYALRYENLCLLIGKRPDDIDPTEWKRDRLLTDADVIQQMVSYLEFAIGKAEDQRGISACRSMQKFEAWLWLLGEEELAGACARAEGYGMNELRLIEDWLTKKGAL